MNEVVVAIVGVFGAMFWPLTLPLGSADACVRSRPRRPSRSR